MVGGKSHGMWLERENGTHRDIINRAEQQVPVGVAVDLGLSLKHHSLIVQRFNDLWLLLRGEDGQKANTCNSR